MLYFYNPKKGRMSVSDPESKLQRLKCLTVSFRSSPEMMKLNSTIPDRLDVKKRRKRVFSCNCGQDDRVENQQSDLHSVKRQKKKKNAVKQIRFVDAAEIT